VTDKQGNKRGLFLVGDWRVVSQSGEANSLVFVIEKKR